MFAFTVSGIDSAFKKINCDPSSIVDLLGGDAGVTNSNLMQVCEEESVFLCNATLLARKSMHVFFYISKHFVSSFREMTEKIEQLS